MKDFKDVRFLHATVQLSRSELLSRFPTLLPPKTTMNKPDAGSYRVPTSPDIPPDDVLGLRTARSHGRVSSGMVGNRISKRAFSGDFGDASNVLSWVLLFAILGKILNTTSSPPTPLPIKITSFPSQQRDSATSSYQHLVRNACLPILAPPAMAQDQRTPYEIPGNLNKGEFPYRKDSTLDTMLLSVKNGSSLHWVSLAWLPLAGFDTEEGFARVDVSTSTPSSFIR